MLRHTGRILLTSYPDVQILADAIGRRKTIMTGALVFTLGGALQTGAQALSYLYAGRCIAGWGYVLFRFTIFVYRG